MLSKRRGDEAPVEIKPEGTQILKPETANTMRRLMQGVVEYGTGKLTARWTVTRLPERPDPLSSTITQPGIHAPLQRLIHGFRSGEPPGIGRSR